MQQYKSLASVYLRLALGATMLSAVADRFGIWGGPGEGAAWGNWQTFVAYTGELNAFMPEEVIPLLAVAATGCEMIFSLMLLLGLRTKIAALGTGCLLGLFALAMTIAYGFKAPLDYSVFIGSGAGFLLASLPEYPFSVDNLKMKKAS